ncbi:MAG TPA: hypothetical protein VIT90_07330 [Lysobacter sp.]
MVFNLRDWRARVMAMTRPAPPSRPSVLAGKAQAARIGFLGTARASNEAGENVIVQSLCWPTLPMAWVELTHSLHEVLVGRGNPGPYTPGVDKPPSWLRACAPQLAKPFCGTAGAEESSIASLLARTSMQAAVAIVDSRDVRTAVAQPQALSRCVSIYNQLIQASTRLPCTMLIAVSQTDPADEQCLVELSRCRILMPNARWLDDLQLQFWSEEIEPLPLELARVVALSTARHVLFEEAEDPLFDAVLTKLAHDPLQGKRPSPRKRR